MRDGSFQLLTQPQVLEETRLLMEHLDSPGSVFRMNHASNYLVLKGTLNRDKEAMLRTIDAAEHDLSRLPAGGVAGPVNQMKQPQSNALRLLFARDRRLDSPCRR